MEINPSEVTKILKEQIKKLGDRAEVSEAVSYTHLTLPTNREV